MSRRFTVIVIGAVVLALAVLAFVVVDPLNRTADQNPVLEEEAHPYRPYSFMWVGNAQRQFTDEEFRELANDYTYVVIAKFHDQAMIESQKEAARRIKAINPSTRVLVYYATSYWHNQRDYGVTFDEERFALKDQDGQTLLYKEDEAEGGVGTYVDLANPEYRAFALGVIQAWLRDAPFDGVAFDNAHLIAADRNLVGQPKTVWADLLSLEKIEAYNQGVIALIRGAQEVLGPDRLVIYNGISQDTKILIDKGLGPLTVADGALNERFCLQLDGTPNDVRADIELMDDPRTAGKILLEKTNLRTDDGQAERWARYCYGAFLLGVRPGYSFFKFGGAYGAKEFDQNPIEASIDIGAPKGAATFSGPIGTRSFEGGEVFTNLSDTPARVVVPRRLWQLDAQGEATELRAGDEIRLPARDAIVAANAPPPAGRASGG